ncbi:WD40 repeat-like protein [Exidia glandulosa HHB12029]|uniref:Elongator complex protein 2 n=1 Tax=Exidia glandulosa HHB12029 TaxID=1314781 RepID=A0A165QR41_EXIGL|nr:WD40 repeat-like protein [Exidia glandulosa HHB12029]
MSATSLYISASTNRQHHAGHCAPGSGLVAFASHKYIALWDTQNQDGRGVYATLPGHNAEVTCVRFLDDDALLSADEAGELILWTRSPDGQARCMRDLDVLTTLTLPQWILAARTKAHERTVSALTVYAGVIVTGSSDATLKVWSLQTDDDKGASSQIQHVQTLDLRGRFAIDVQIDTLPGTSVLVMAVGTTDRNVGIFTRSEGQSDFTHALSLPGHDDWVRSLSFSHSINPHGQTLSLASGSQDGTIRLWQFASASTKPQTGLEDAADDLLDAFEASLDEVGDEGGRQISLKRHTLGVKAADGSTKTYHVTFDALLVGHEAGVTSVAWRPGAPILLSTSTDSSVILWTNDSASGLWINAQRFGDIGGQKLGGFVGGLWASRGMDALAWGWTGGWRRWREVENGKKWEEVEAITGHQGTVRGLCWSPDGSYLVSTSYDQSTRIHGPVPVASGAEVWHELARPQVHGYDLVAAAFVNPLQFVSVADERVARVFDAPRRFTTLLDNLGTVAVAAETTASRPVAASVPPLQLSNKAECVDAAEEEDSSLDNLARVPFEGELASRTLWPETEKVFGHGYELIAIGASHAGELIATACKSTSAEHAVVRVYETNTWQQVGKPLEGHVLTVTRIRWSPDDLFILTVSRDRSWRLFGPRTADNHYPPCASTPKAHARIVWDCAWAHDGSFFVTVARDKTARVWTSTDESRMQWTDVATIKLDDAGTAVDILPADASSSRIHMAVGHENGKVNVYTSEKGVPQKWTVFAKLDSSIAGIDHIYQLAWRPKKSGGREMQAGEGMATLALCSEDKMLRLLDVRLD